MFKNRLTLSKAFPTSERQQINPPLDEDVECSRVLFRDKVDRLQEQRERYKIIDINGLLEQFPEKVRTHILRSTPAIQFTDGCTGGCAWCAFDVKRKITEGFSLEGWQEFSRKYANQLPDTISLYWASDPADIAGITSAGCRYNYADVVKTTLPHLRPGQRIYTSTVAPEGTLPAIKELLIYLYHHWIDHDFYSAEANVLHTVRFSINDKNKHDIANLRRELEAEFPEQPNFWEIVFGMAESRENLNYKKTGKFIDHPERDPLSADIESIACYDGTLIAPSGIYSISSEAATKDSPFGHTSQKLDSGQPYIELPEFQVLAGFWGRNVRAEILRGRAPRMVPNVVMNRINTTTGVIESVKAIPTLRRDLLAYFQVVVAAHFLSEDDLNAKQLAALTALEGQMDERWLQTKALIPDSKDQEAKDLIEPFYKDAKIRISDIKAK